LMTFTFESCTSASWRWWMFRATEHKHKNRTCRKDWELIQEDCCWIIHELGDTTGISYGVCQEILEGNLSVCCSALKFVPWLLTNEQKQPHINMCLELERRLTRAKLLSLGP
jgi:hypothetical protein